MSLVSFLTTIVRALNEAEIPFMLTGSLAAAFYGTPRATQDIDLVIETQPGNLERLIHNLELAGLYVDRGAAIEALDTAGQFNAIDPTSGWKADFPFRHFWPGYQRGCWRQDRIIMELPPRAGRTTLAVFRDVFLGRAHRVKHERGSAPVPEPGPRAVAPDTTSG